MTHIHHIVPKHAGGSNDSKNLKELTILDHAREHEKLYLESGEFGDLVACVMLYGQAKKLEQLSPELREEHRRMKSEHQKGKKLSNETKRKLSLAKTGDRHPMFRKGHLQTGNKNPFSKWHEIISPTGEKFVIKGPHQFFKEHGLNHGSMTSVSQGKQNNHKGWTCRYLTGQEIQ